MSLFLCIIIVQFLVIIVVITPLNPINRFECSNLPELKIESYSEPPPKLWEGF